MSEPRRRDTPNPERPRLSKKAEERLLPMDRASAEAYTLIEDGMAKLDAILAEGGVVTEALAEAGDTMVHRIAASAAVRPLNPEPPDDER